MIAIGDIHGRLSKLTGLIEKIGSTAKDRLVFLGDYIDRGPDSYEVVEFILKFRQEFPKTITLRGNHEDFVVSLFMGNQNQNDRQLWLKSNGGDRTISSYDRHGCYLKKHQEFYMNLPLSYETD